MDKERQELYNVYGHMVRDMVIIGVPVANIKEEMEKSGFAISDEIGVHLQNIYQEELHDYQLELTRRTCTHEQHRRKKRDR